MSNVPVIANMKTQAGKSVQTPRKHLTYSLFTKPTRVVKYTLLKYFNCPFSDLPADLTIQA
jgi:hypothetical protein